MASDVAGPGWLDRRRWLPGVDQVEAGTALTPLWRDGLFWLALALTAFAVAPFLLPGYFWGANDARHHVYFLFEYNRSVADGIWWPRWSPDFAFGYGYPFFNIYGPFSHFLAELLLYFLGFSYTGAVEAIFALSIVGSAAAMYGYVRTWAGRRAALLSAVVYVYVPYHLLNLYVRANLAESMAFVWLPLCLWGARAATLRPTLRSVTGLAVSYAGLMLTSNLIIVLFTPLLGLYLLVLTLVYALPPELNVRRTGWGMWAGWWLRRSLAPALGILAGLGVSAVFWLPMVLERQYVRVDQWFGGRYDFRGHFVYFFQLFSPRWGFGVSTTGPDDPIGFQLGPAALLLALAGVYLVWRQAGRLRWEIACFVAAGLVATFLALRWAAPLWEMPLLGAILGAAQFPWRWLSITALCLGVLAGLPLYNMARETEDGVTWPLVTLAAAALLASYPLLRVEITQPAEGPVGLAALMRFQQSSDEMTGSTAWVKEIPTWSPMADEYIRQEREGEPGTPVPSMVDYTTLQYNCETGFVVDSPRPRTTISEEVWYCAPQEGRRIVFNQFYYPGWKAYLLDGPQGAPVRELEIIPEEEGTLGRMTVPVPPGEGYVLLRFEDTPPRRAGKAISLATVVLLVGTALAAWWRTRQEIAYD